MKEGYRNWVTVSVIAAGAVVLGLIVFLRRGTPTIIASPSPPASVGTALTSSRPTTSPILPSVSPATSRDLAKAAYAKGDYAAAIALYDAAIGQTAEAKIKAELLNLLGNSYRDAKSLGKALDSYAKAISFDEALVAAYINTSNIYISQNKKSDARIILEKGLKINPGNVNLERELSIVNLTGTSGER